MKCRIGLWCVHSKTSYSTDIELYEDENVICRYCLKHLIKYSVGCCKKHRLSW